MSHLAGGHSLEAFVASLVESVGRKRGRLFVTLSFFPPYLTHVLSSVRRSLTMGMMGKFKLLGGRGFAPQLKK